MARKARAKPKTIARTKTKKASKSTATKKKSKASKKRKAAKTVRSSIVRAKPKPQARLFRAPALTAAVNAIDQITAMAAGSEIARFKWTDNNGDQDRAPLAYIKGMAVVYARVYCKLKANDPAAVEMAKRNAGDTARDALAFCNNLFVAAGMSNNTDGVDTLRHLFVFLVGLGIRESSGRYCVGRYMRDPFDQADSAEAGLFQSSYNLNRHSPAILTACSTTMPPIP